MENIHFSHDVEKTDCYVPELAGRWDRFLAKLIDSGFIIGIGLITVILGSLGDEQGILMGVLSVSGLLCLLICQAYLLTTRGQTIGKLEVRIRIIRADTGENGGFVYNFLLRGVVNYVIASIIPLYGLVDTLFIFSEDRRCIHDKIAGTKVVSAF